MRKRKGRRGGEVIASTISPASRSHPPCARLLLRRYQKARKGVDPKQREGRHQPEYDVVGHKGRSNLPYCSSDRTADLQTQKVVVPGHCSTLGVS